MTKKQIVISDLTQEQITDFVTISVERVGYMIEYPDGYFTNRLLADVESNRVPELMARIKYHENQSRVPMSKNIVLG